jgi:hypothetical protein
LTTTCNFKSILYYSFFSHHANGSCHEQRDGHRVLCHFDDKALLKTNLGPLKVVQKDVNKPCNGFSVRMNDCTSSLVVFGAQGIFTQPPLLIVDPALVRCLLDGWMCETNVTLLIL